MAEPLVLSERLDGVLLLKLNRPAALNSFTTALHAELLGALDAAATDAAVRAVVLTGVGRAFCAGQDLSDAVVAPDARAPKDLQVVIEQYYRPLVLRLRSLPVPTLAAVNGVAAGAGANLALACDLVIAGQSASFLQAFAKIGLVPDTGGTWLLPRLVGRAQALGLAMLGDKLSAAEAERIGLIWRQVEDAALLEVTLSLARRLAAMPSRALVATRAAMDAAMQLDLPQALDAEARLQGELGRAHDYHEGVAAFMAKRAPVFTDR